MIVGEAPSYQEVEQGKPFVGPSGQILNDWLYSNDISRDDVYVTNVLKYQLPGNKWSGIDKDYLGKATDDLWTEIRTIRPNCILSLGEHALNALTGKRKITRYRGSILTSLNGLPKVVPTFHPAAFLYSEETDVKAMYAYYHICKLDVGRALQESLTRDISLPHRNLLIAENAYQVINFLESNRLKKRVAADIESVVKGSCPDMLGLAYDKSVGMCISLVNIVKGIKVSDITDTDLTIIWRAIQERVFGRADVDKIGVNFKYDHEKLEDLGFRIRGQIHDLRQIGHTIEPEYPGANQAFYCSVYTREPYYKDEGREFDPKKDDIKVKKLYNAKDAVTEYEEFEEMWKELEEDPIILEFYSTFVQKLHKFYMNLEATGFEFDKKYRDEILRPKYNKLIEDSEKELYSIAGREFNTASWQQVAKIIYDEMKIPRRAGTDEKTIQALLANTIKKEEQRTFCQGLLNVRRYKKAKSTSIEIELDFDGRLRTSYNICGTETGRSSTSKPDEPVRPFLSGLAFHTIPKRGQGADIRKAIKPHKDCVILELDYKNAEGWIVAHLANDTDLLEFMKLGGDTHKLRASWFYDKRLGNTTVKQAIQLLKNNDPLIKMDDVDKLERYVGKKGGHGGNYGEGKRNLMEDINNESAKLGTPLNLSEWKCGKILDKFHEYSPNIRGVYHREIEEHVNENKTLYNPFGRRRRFLGRDDTRLYKEAYATIPQGTVPDAARMAAMRFLEAIPEAKICIEWHDNISLMAPLSEWEDWGRLLKKEMEEPIDFTKCSLSRGLLSIPVETVVYFDNWKDGKEVEL